MFPHLNIHKYTLNLSRWADLQSDWSHIARYEVVFECTKCTKFQSSWFWYLSPSVGCKSQGKIGSNKQAEQKFDEVRFNLKKLNNLEVRKQYQIEITNIVAALENLSDDEDINMAWENIKEDIKTSAKDSLDLH